MFQPRGNSFLTPKVLKSFYHIRYRDAIFIDPLINHGELSMKRLLWLLSWFVLIGCAPVHRLTHPDFNKQARSIKKYLLVTPDVKIYELSAGGLHELRDDWCAQGQNGILNALQTELKKRKVALNDSIINPNDENFKDTRTLYEAVSHTVMTHVIGNSAYRFPSKYTQFDYSIGSVASILEKYEADALIFTFGFDEVASSGRQALSAIGFFTGALTGVYVTPRSSITFVSLAIVNKEGKILWYGTRQSEGGTDLRSSKATATIIHNILNDYPGFKK